MISLAHQTPLPWRKQTISWKFFQITNPHWLLRNTTTPSLNALLLLMKLNLKVAAGKVDGISSTSLILIRVANLAILEIMVLHHTILPTLFHKLWTGLETKKDIKTNMSIKQSCNTFQLRMKVNLMLWDYLSISLEILLNHSTVLPKLTNNTPMVIEVEITSHYPRRAVLTISMHSGTLPSMDILPVSLYLSLIQTGTKLKQM